MSTGTVLVDLPGTADTNSARCSIVKDYMNVGYWVVVTRHPQLGNSDGVAPHKSVACETVFCLVLIERS